MALNQRVEQEYLERLWEQSAVSDSDAVTVNSQAEHLISSGDDPPANQLIYIEPGNKGTILLVS